MSTVPAFADDLSEVQLPPVDNAKGLKRLSKEDEIWVDITKKRVLVRGEVCLREGQLELFACPKNSKEHESVVAVYSKAYLVHAALLAIGAKTGAPARFVPKYRSASGTEIEVRVMWVEAGKLRNELAQYWVRHLKTGKQMEHAWVFAGSGFWTDETTGERTYNAEAGDLICVSNFATAMLDLPVASPQANNELHFHAFTDRIPELETTVWLILTPKPEAEMKD